MKKLMSMLLVLNVLLIRFAAHGTGCSTLYQLRSISSTYGSLRLRDGGFAGYLEICGPSNPIEWTPVCGEDWTDIEALTACNILGYSNTTSIAIAGGLCFAPPGNITTGVEILDCSGTERSVEECQSAEAPTCNEWGGVICSSLEVCPAEVCSNTSYCHASSTCINCFIPQELNCICYGECSSPCLNGGNCTYNNTCQCPPDWEGERCDKRVPQVTTSKASITTSISCSVMCLNGGTCFNDSCLCITGYDGPLCENEKGGYDLILYIIISLLVVLLIVSIGTTTIVLTVILTRKSKRKKKLQMGSGSIDSNNEEEEYLKMYSVTDTHRDLQDQDEMQEIQCKITVNDTEAESPNQLSYKDMNVEEEIYTYDKLLEKSWTEDDYATVTDNNRTGIRNKRWYEKQGMTTDGYENSLPRKKQNLPEIHTYYTLEDTAKSSQYSYAYVMSSDQDTEIKLDCQANVGSKDKKVDNANKTKVGGSSNELHVSYCNSETCMSLSKDKKSRLGEVEYYDFEINKPNTDMKVENDNKTKVEGSDELDDVSYYNRVDCMPLSKDKESCSNEAEYCDFEINEPDIELGQHSPIS